jgi:hypothetical protein
LDFFQSAFDIDAGPNMKWLARFASSQKNIDCIAAWLGSALVAFAAVLVLIILGPRIFK